MIIGTVREIKNLECRVGLIPSFISRLVKDGHDVIVESGAGTLSGFPDETYLEAGARIVASPEDVYSYADMIVKVKEPQRSECKLLRESQIIFTFLHLAANQELTQALIDSKSICIAYETITDDFGGLPILDPMSAIAGRMSVIIAANILQHHNNGKGILISGVPGVVPAKVAIIGGGRVGSNAASMAYGMGADVTVLDKNIEVLKRIDETYNHRIKTIVANRSNLTEVIKDADIVIGAILVKGSEAPKIITRDMLKIMKQGSVIIDTAIDQGGCFETSYPTTLADPTYEVDGIIHYCVTNMPGAFPRTSTIALNNSAFNYIKKISDLGCVNAILSDPHLMNGLNIYKGNITYKTIADIHNLPYTDPCRLLK